jgi:hypothetical protein
MSSLACQERTPFHSQMLCFVETIAYDFDNKRGQVWIANEGCTDMGGCIAFFERIDPGVTRIETYSSDRPDTKYFKNLIGKWEAR